MARGRLRFPLLLPTPDSRPQTPDSRLNNTNAQRAGSPGVGSHRSDSLRQITTSRHQALLRSIATGGSHFAAGAAGEAAVGSLDAARLLRSAARLVGRAAVLGSTLGTGVAALLAASLAARGSWMAAAGPRGRLRTHSIADQSQDRGTEQRHHISTIHDNLPNRSRKATP